MKIISLVEELVVEASKKDVLIQKLGFSNDNAEVLANLTGSLAVWMGNKLIDLVRDNLKSFGQEEVSREDIIGKINSGMLDNTKTIVLKPSIRNQESGTNH